MSRSDPATTMIDERATARSEQEPLFTKTRSLQEQSSGSIYANLPAPAPDILNVDGDDDVAIECYPGRVVIRRV